MPIPLPVLYALAAQARLPQRGHLPAASTRPVVRGIGPSRTFQDYLELLNMMQRYGLWPTTTLPDYGFGIPPGFPAPDMPDLGFPRPVPGETYPGEDFEIFYGPGPMDVPWPLPYRRPQRLPAIPYPIGPPPGANL